MHQFLTIENHNKSAKEQTIKKSRFTRMQQQDKGGSEEIMKQNQDRRLKTMMQSGDNQQHQPQKCPRCESLNTKFCYYNNYSLSQPRYFCKTCRRYWTQGGTLRNVPVGGGCRKGKRAKTSSSSSSSSSTDNSRSHQSQQNIISTSTTNNTTSASPALMRAKESAGINSVSSPGVSSIGPYYSGGGFLTSLATIQSMNNQPPALPPLCFGPNQPVNLVSGDLGGASNLSLLHAFNSVPSFGSQQHHPIQQQRQFYLMGSGRDTNERGGDLPFYASSYSQQQNWHQLQGLISNANPTVVSYDTALWSISTTTTTGNNTNSNTTATPAGSLPLNSAGDPRQWHDLPDYGPPS